VYTVHNSLLSRSRHGIPRLLETEAGPKYDRVQWDSSISTLVTERQARLTSVSTTHPSVSRNYSLERYAKSEKSDEADNEPELQQRCCCTRLSASLGQGFEHFTVSTDSFPVNSASTQKVSTELRHHWLVFTRTANTLITEGESKPTLQSQK
jgi:hypothetical protein